jgi:hypothetical protein
MKTITAEELRRLDAEANGYTLGFNVLSVNHQKTYKRLADELTAHFAEPEASPWIPLSERKPTKEDANELGEVLQRLNTGRCVSWKFDSLSVCIAWMPIPSYTPKPKDECREAFEREWPAMYPDLKALDKEMAYAAFRIAWNAALAQSQSPTATSQAH